jgi:hypothetical protein
MLRHMHAAYAAVMDTPETRPSVAEHSIGAPR